MGRKNRKVSNETKIEYARRCYENRISQSEAARQLGVNGELNVKYHGGVKRQKEKLEAEGHTIIERGRKNIRYYVQDYEQALCSLQEIYTQ